jgi:hypothetical protein
MKIDAPVPGIVRSVDDLVELARAINASHTSGEKASRQGLQHFREAGMKLLSAKSKCKQGEWLPWLKEHVHFSKTQAYRYMSLAKLPVKGNLEDEWRTLSGNEKAGPNWCAAWDRAGVHYLAASGRELKDQIEAFFGSTLPEEDEDWWDELLCETLATNAGAYWIRTGTMLPIPKQPSGNEVKRHNGFFMWEFKVKHTAGLALNWLEEIGVKREQGFIEWPDPPPAVDLLKASFAKVLNEGRENEEKKNVNDDVISEILQVSKEDVNQAIQNWALGHFVCLLDCC